MPPLLRKRLRSHGQGCPFHRRQHLPVLFPQPRGSKAKAIDEPDIARFLKLAEDNGFGTLLAHAPYTLNPCSADPKVTRFAAQVLREDLELMEHLPGNLYNFHPGSHVGQGVEKALNWWRTN